MKLFISYGHQPAALAAFVHRVADDLEKRGYAIWIDSKHINDAHPDWRRALTDALAAGPVWTLGFLSRHAMRKVDGSPGITRQEMAFALDRNAGRLATVLVEKLADDWSVPPGLGRHQWVDMSDWKDRQDDVDWYNGKLEEIAKRLDPASAALFDREMALLATHLSPVRQGADIDQLVDGFVGRKWLLEKLETWRQDPKGHGMFWLTAQPGTGKSAFAAWLAHSHSANVVTLNLCHWSMPDRCNPQKVFTSLAYELARRVPDYRAHLLTSLRAQARNPAYDGGIDPAGLFKWLADSPPDALFEALLVEPLYHAFNGGLNTDKLLLVIDGLDEALDNARHFPTGGLVQTLIARGKMLPPWLGLLVTSRHDVLAAEFGRDPDVHIDDSDGNRADLRLYTAAWLRTRKELTDAERGAWLVAIEAAADGNFMYLRKFQEGVEQRGFPLDPKVLPELPKGLGGIYLQWFRRQFVGPAPRVHDLASYRRDFAPLLAVLVAADNAVPEELLTELLGWTDPFQAADRLGSLGSLFQRRGDGWMPCHKSLRDWLPDRGAATADFFVDVADARRRLADLLGRRLASAGGAALPAGFLRAEFPSQITAMDAGAQTEWLAAHGGTVALRASIRATIAALQDGRAWQASLAWCAVAQALAMAGGDHWLGTFVAVGAGDIHSILGNSEAAMAAFREAKKFAALRAEDEKDNPDAQHDLSVSFNKIGDLLIAQGKGDEAMKAYRDSSAIFERLVKADPGNARWQRDLSVSFEKIGDVLIAQGKGDEAMKAYRDSSAIFERLAKGDPGNAGWQRDLAVSFNKIGDVLVAQGKGDDALKAFRDGHAIAERLARDDPGNAGWQRDLSVSFDGIGDVLAAQGKGDEAMKAYRDGLAIRERLAKADPGNAGWQRDLAVSFNKIGDVLVAQGKGDEAMKAYRDSLVIAERLAKDDPGNAGWQRDLAVSVGNIALVQRGLGEMAEALANLRRGREIMVRLVALDPNNTGWRGDLAWFDGQIAEIGK